MRWRYLRANETDHEVLWLSVSVGAALVGGFWVRYGLPVPTCTWHELTGFACPSCGATRCVRALYRGDIEAAFLVNPLFFLSVGLIVAYNLYAATVVIGRLPRLRFEHVPSSIGWSARIGIPVLIVINWIWLIVRGV